MKIKISILLAFACFSGVVFGQVYLKFGSSYHRENLSLATDRKEVIPFQFMNNSVGIDFRKARGNITFEMVHSSKSKMNVVVSRYKHYYGPNGGPGGSENITYSSNYDLAYLGFRVAPNVYTPFNKRFSNSAFKIGFFFQVELNYKKKINDYHYNVEEHHSVGDFSTPIPTFKDVVTKYDVYGESFPDFMKVRFLNTYFGLNTAYVININKSYLEFRMAIGGLFNFRYYNSFPYEPYLTYHNELLHGYFYDYFSLRNMFYEFGLSYGINLPKKSKKEVETKAFGLPKN